MQKKLSIIALMMVFISSTFLSHFLPVFATDIEKDKNIFTDVTVTDDKGNTLDANQQADYMPNVDTDLYVHLDWSLDQIQFVEGEDYIYTLPSELSVLQEQSGELTTSSGEKVGTYLIDTSGKISITFHALPHTDDLNGKLTIRTKFHQNDTTSEEYTQAHMVFPLANQKKQITIVFHNPEKTLNNEQKTQKSLSSQQINENIITKVQLNRIGENGESEVLKPGEKIIVQNPYEMFKVQLDYRFALPNNHNYRSGATYTIDIPDVFNVLANPEPIPLKNNAGTTFATVVVQNDNKIVITFNDEIEKNSEVSGFIQLESELKAHYKGPAETEIHFPIADEKTITYPIKFIPNGDAIDKKGVPNREYNAETITWTIDFNKNLQEINNAILADEQQGEHTFVEGSLKVYKLHMNADGTINEDKTEEINPSFGDKFPLQLGNIDSAYRVVYQTKINDETGTQYTNKALLKGYQFDEVTSLATVNVKRGEPLQKKAIKYNNVTQTITWEVKFNYNEKTITQDKAKLADTFGNNQGYSEDSLKVYEVTIDPQTGQEKGVTEVSKDAYGVKQRENGFDLQFRNNIHKAYKIVYDTKVNDRVEKDEVVTNTISDEFGHDQKSNQTIQQGILIKSLDKIDYNTKETTWKITINRDKHKMSNVTLIDTFPQGFTLKNEIKMTHGGKDFTDFTKTFDETTGELKIQFPKEITEKVDIYYTTAIDFDKVNPDSKAYKNSAKLTWVTEDGTAKSKDGSAVFNPNPYTKDNGFKAATYNPVTKEITWTIGVNYNKKELKNVKVRDLILGMQNFNIKNVKIYKMIIDINGGTKKGEEISKEVLPISGEKNEPGFEVHLGTIDHPYLIEYTTDLNDLVIVDEYQNDATVLTDDTASQTYHASVKPKHGGKYVTKSAAQDKDNPRIVNWAVKINETQSTITNAKVTDRPSINQTLLTDSIKLYETTIVNGDMIKDPTKLLQEGEDYTVKTEEDEKGQITFTIAFTKQIDRAYVLEYQTYILYKADGNFSNTVKFTADEVSTEKNTSVSNKIDFSKISGGIDGEVGNLIIKKMDADDRTTPLKGATFELYDASGQTLLKTATTDEKGIATFKNLLYTDYLLKETEAPKGYNLGINGQQQVKIDKKEVEQFVYNEKMKVNIAGTKTWKDDDPQNRPNHITIQLKNGTEVVQEKTLPTTGEDQLAYEFTNVPKYDHEGKEIKYTIDELPVDGYKSEINGYDITNVRSGKTSITVTKKWKDDNNKDQDRPKSIEVSLWQNGKPFKTGIISADNQWKYEFTNLEAYNHEGKPFTYTIKEKAVDGYQTSIDGYEITNLRVGTTSVAGKKIWKDDNNKDQDRPDKIQIHLLQNGEIIDQVDVSAASNWMYNFTDLPKYDENGVAYKYTIEEVPIKGYKTLINGYNITNIRTATTTVEGIKSWDDHDFKHRPEKIMVDLLQNGKVIDTAEVTADTDWKYAFTDLAKYDSEGKPYIYTVQEHEVNGYESIISGYNLTNKLILGKVELMKLDNNGHVLEGAVFDLQDHDGRVLLKGLTTNQDGKIYVDQLQPGDYQFVETKAPQGYELNTKPITFTIEKGQKEPLILTVVNEKIPLPTEHVQSPGKGGQPNQSVSSTSPVRDSSASPVGANKLPNTGQQHLYYMLITGFSLLVIGGIILFFKKRRIE